MRINPVGSTTNSVENVLKNHKPQEWTKNNVLDGLNFSELDKIVSTPSSIVENKKSFADLLASSIGEVNQLQKEADKAIQKLVTGKSKNIHETMLAVERADIAFRTMNQIRSKVIDAYKEIMRIQV